MPARRLPDFDRGSAVSLRVADQPLRAFDRESIAVALYAAGTGVLSRSLKYHRPRSFFCLEGHCGSCLMRIGGRPNLRACMERCAEGVSVEAQNAYPSASMDVLGAVDWLFPGGMNHHTLMTGSRILNSVVSKVVRQLGGLGKLPDGAPAVGRGELAAPDVLVVGAGPAGLSAAIAAARAGAATLLCDEQEQPGGSLLADPRGGAAEAGRLAGEARRAGVRIESGMTAIGFFPEDDGVIALAGGDRLICARPRATVYATGGYAQNRPFANNDRPGVLAARAVGRLLCLYGVVPGNRICVIGGDGAEADYAAALGAALAAAGCEVSAIDPRHERVLGARGRVWVKALEVSDAAGKTRKVPCDLIAVAAPPAPASEAPRQHGCRVELRPRAGGFAVLAEPDGQTSVPGVFACGDVCGATSPAAAAAAGERAGRAAVQR
jgi:sarcosine oxidase subunit alpha